MPSTSHTSPRLIGVVTTALMLLLGLTVLLSTTKAGKVLLLPALVIAGVKATIVAYYFMDIRRSPVAIRLVAGAALAWLVIVLGGTMTDYLTRR